MPQPPHPVSLAAHRGRAAATPTLSTRARIPEALASSCSQSQGHPTMARRRFMTSSGSASGPSSSHTVRPMINSAVCLPWYATPVGLAAVRQCVGLLAFALSATGVGHGANQARAARAPVGHEADHIDPDQIAPPSHRSARRHASALLGEHSQYRLSTKDHLLFRRKACRCTPAAWRSMQLGAGQRHRQCAEMLLAWAAALWSMQTGNACSTPRPARAPTPRRATAGHLPAPVHSGAETAGAVPRHRLSVAQLAGRQRDSTGAARHEWRRQLLAIWRIAAGAVQPAAPAPAPCRPMRIAPPCA